MLNSILSTIILLLICCNTIFANQVSPGCGDTIFSDQTSHTCNQINSSELRNWINSWIIEERGKQNIFGILATIDQNGNPKTRVVEVREIHEEGQALFFTQKGSAKVKHIEKNSNVSLTIYLPDKGRQITFNGKASPLNDQENNSFWETYPKLPQIRFTIYGPRSGEVVENNDGINEDLVYAIEKNKSNTITRPEAYIGYYINFKEVKLYQYNPGNKLSDSFVIEKNNNIWIIKRVVP